MKQRQTLWRGVLRGQRLRFTLAMACVALTAAFAQAKLEA